MKNLNKQKKILTKLQVVNKNRRNFLKVSLIGSGLFLLWKIFPFLKLENFGESDKKALRAGNKFKIEEDEKNLAIFNAKGKKVFTIDQDGEIEV